MKTSGTNFELIMQEVLRQKQLMENLQTENKELRHQLADLRDGQGIFIEILGKRYPLVGEPVHTSPEVVSTAQADVSLQETTAITSEALTPSIPETPLPETGLTVEEVPEVQPPLASPEMPGFLEEALLNEFSAASTRQMSVWSGPVTNHPIFDEKEKESLRRELSGSFLLE